MHGVGAIVDVANIDADGVQVDGRGFFTDDLLARRRLSHRLGEAVATHARVPAIAAWCRTETEYAGLANDIIFDINQAEKVIALPCIYCSKDI